MAVALTEHLDTCACTAWSRFSPCRPFLAAGMTPMGWQRSLLHSVCPNSRALALGARQGSGKTSVAGAVALNVGMVAPGRTIAVIGPSESAPAEFIRKLKVLAKAMDLEFVGAGAKTSLEFRVGEGTSRIVALPANIETIRGLTCHALVCEEMRGIPTELIAAAMPFLSTTHGSLVAIGTPGSATGALYDYWVADNGWHKFKITAEDLVAGGRLTREFVDEQKLMMSDVHFRREFMAEFVSAEGSLLNAEDIERAFERGALVHSLFDDLEL